jgi:hypothetical protein
LSRIYHGIHVYDAGSIGIKPPFAGLRWNWWMEIMSSGEYLLDLAAKFEMGTKFLQTSGLNA